MAMDTSHHPLAALRDFYLERFRQSIAKATLELDGIATELLIEIPSLPHSEYCYRLYRVDVIGQRDGVSQVREVTLSEGSQASNCQWAQSHNVKFAAPIVWYGIEFEVTGICPHEELISWTSRWLDIEDERWVDSQEFQMVIHSVTPPTRTVNGFQISVDFGSAPLEAFDELVQLLSKTAELVSIGSFSLFNDETEISRDSPSP